MFIFYFTSLTMSGGKIAIRATCVKKDWVLRQQQKKLMLWKTQKLSMNVWHKTGSDIFKEGDTSLEDKPRSGKPSVVEDETLLEIVEQQPSTSLCTLSAELGPSQTSINTSISSTLWTDSEILEILQNFWFILVVLNSCLIHFTCLSWKIICKQ